MSHSHSGSQSVIRSASHSVKTLILIRPGKKTVVKSVIYLATYTVSASVKSLSYSVTEAVIQPVILSKSQRTIHWARLLSTCCRLYKSICTLCAFVLAIFIIYKLVSHNLQNKQCCPSTQLLALMCNGHVSTLNIHNPSHIEISHVLFSEKFACCIAEL